jgi:purine-nucleoside phosphorylase
MTRFAKDATVRALRRSELVSGAAPLLARTDHVAPSVFRPENMLREARRQKGLAPGSVPAVCVLDPDGDIVDHVRRTYGATRCPHWACYHTKMWTWRAGDLTCGIIGHVVGGSFSVLVAEQLFASGCGLLLSIASAGQITNVAPPPYYILIERALRDEGTSYHYLPPSNYVEADPALVTLAAGALAQAGGQFHVGDTWTTDAPFRETAESIASRRSAGILAVEMEAAALYAFAAACERPVICLAHVSNQLGCVDGDFEKGDGNGAAGSFDLVMALAAAWRRETQAAEQAAARVAT